MFLIHLDPLQMKDIYERFKKDDLDWTIKETEPDFWIYTSNIGGPLEHSCKIFDPIQAKSLYNFIKENIGKDFYIHCAAGASRSQGVVVFILNEFPDIYNETSLNQSNKPNLLVYNRWICRLLEKEHEYDGNSLKKCFDDCFLQQKNDVIGNYSFDDLL